MQNNVEQLFMMNNRIMTTSELRDAGIYYKKIRQLISEEKIEQIRRGYYHYVKETDFSEIHMIEKLFPDGILCLESALDYYGYTDRTPSSWHVAVDSKSTRTRFYIDYPSVTPHFVRTNRYLLGVSEGEIDGNKIRIYDREKTICDLLFHRNKIETEVFNNAIQRYVKDTQKNEANLIVYAKVMHVEKKVMEVLGIWL